MRKRNPPDDHLEGPGFTMTRRGRQIHMETHRSPQEQRELLQRMKESRPGILAEIRSKTDELLCILHKYSSLDLVANLLLKEIFHDPDEYVESENKLHPHYVEHAAILELKDSHYELRSPVLVQAKDVEDASALIDAIFTQSYWYYIAESADPSRTGPPSRLEELRFITLLHGMFVRSPAYSSHWRDVLMKLLGEGSALERLSREHHLNINNALAITQAIEEYVVDALQERVDNARFARAEFLENLRKYKASGRFEGRQDEKELLDRVRNLRSKEAKRAINVIFAEWTRVALGTVLSFKAEELALITNIRIEEVRAFCGEISLEFGSTNAEYLLPAPVNKLHERPLIQYDNTTFFCPAPHLLMWSIKPAFERVLAKTSYWNSYQKHRSSFLVKSSLEHLQKLLPGASIYTGLFYPDPNSARGDEAELDALVLFDRYTFLIEGKAGVLGSARRAGALKIKSQLQELVGDAIDQVVRAATYVRNTQIPVFRTASGGMVTIDKNKYTDQILMTVTLDVLDLFTAELYQMRDIGVVKPNHELPWVVALTDLRAISEILVRPTEFTHYLKWRLSASQDPSLSGGRDEMNWLAVYLMEGPRHPSAPASRAHLMFTSYTDSFDAYFLYLDGSRTIPAERPSQPLPTPIDKVLDALVEGQRHRFTEVGEYLLDLDFAERSRFAETLTTFSFHESRGQSSRAIFESATSAIVLEPRTVQVETSEKEARVLSVSLNKPVLVMSLSSLSRWTVLHWSVAYPS